MKVANCFRFALESREFVEMFFFIEAKQARDRMKQLMTLAASAEIEADALQDFRSTVDSLIESRASASRQEGLRIRWRTTMSRIRKTTTTKKD